MISPRVNPRGWVTLLLVWGILSPHSALALTAGQVLAGRRARPVVGPSMRGYSRGSAEQVALPGGEVGSNNHVIKSGPIPGGPEG